MAKRLFLIGKAFDDFVLLQLGQSVRQCCSGHSEALVKIIETAYAEKKIRQYQQ